MVAERDAGNGRIVALTKDVAIVGSDAVLRVREGVGVGIVRKGCNHLCRDRPVPKLDARDGDGLVNAHVLPIVVGGSDGVGDGVGLGVGDGVGAFSQEIS